MQENNLNEQPTITYLKFTVLPLWILATIAVGYVLHSAAEVFIWITCSFLLFALLDPWYLAFRRKNISSVLSALILITSVMVITITLLYTLYYFSSDLIGQLQESKKLFQEYYNNIVGWIKSMISGISHPSGAVPARDVVTGKIIPKVEIVEGSPLGGAMGDTVLTGVGSAATFLTYFCLWPILTFFMMAEREVLGKVIRRTFTDTSRAEQMWTKIVSATRAFFLGNLLLVLVTMPIFAVIFQIFGAKPVIILAILSSMFNAIPFLGAVLTGALPAFAIIASTQNLAVAIWVYIFCGFFHFVGANFITPKILGSQVNLNATTSTIALIFWSMLWGPMGLILAIPITATIKTIFEHSGYAWLCWIAALMSEKIDPLIRITIGWKKAAPETK